jgi:hypothetical protein
MPSTVPAAQESSSVSTGKSEPGQESSDDPVIPERIGQKAAQFDVIHDDEAVEDAPAELRIARP